MQKTPIRIFRYAHPKHQLHDIPGDTAMPHHMLYRCNPIGIVPDLYVTFLIHPDLASLCFRPVPFSLCMKVAPVSPFHINSLDDLRAVSAAWRPPLLGGLILDFDNTLASLRTPHAALMAQGARTAQQFLEAQGLELFPEFWESVIEARRFALHKSEEEEEEHIANDTMSFLLQFCGYPASRMDEKVLGAAVDLFYAPEMTDWALLPAVPETLDALRKLGVRLAIAANYPCERVFQRTLDYLHLRPYFDMVLCSASVEWRKPGAEIFDLILQHWNLRPHEIAVVGDSLKHDVAGGQQLGALTVLCQVAEPDTQTAFDNQQLRKRIRPDATLEAWPALVDMVRTWL